MSKKAAMIEALLAVVGTGSLISSSEEMAPFVMDWRGRRQGRAHCVVFPKNTEEVSAIMRIAARYNEPVFPVGGNTGLCFGAVPQAQDPVHPGIMLSLRRMNTIREIDRIANLVTVDAGVVLGDLHNAVAAEGRSLPMHLGSEGSAQIGGLISTNAGGTNVIRYGPMRDLVAGLELVLADGTILRNLEGLKKNNTGYMLDQLFIGAEGTLGIITAAVLKLHPRIATSAHAWIGLNSPSDATSLLALFRDRAPNLLEACELVSRSQYELVLRHIERVRLPFAELPAWSLMVELGSADAATDLDAIMEDVLQKGYETGLILDAVIASSQAQAEEIWHFRHSVSEANKKEGIGIVHDVCVRVSRVPDFIQAADEVSAARFPSAKSMVVCHLGDGNVHYTLMFQRQDVPADDEVFALEVEKAIHDVAVRLDGTISAEHGIGRKLTSELERLADPARIQVMRQIKSLLDPDNRLNPGVLLNPCMPDHKGA